MFLCVPISDTITLCKAVQGPLKLGFSNIVYRFIFCLDAHKYKKYQEIQHYPGSDKPRMLFFLPINVKVPTVVDILTFRSKKNVMLS